MGGKEKQNCSNAVERDRMKEVKAVRSRLIQEACLLPRTMVTSRPGLRWGAIFRSVAL